MPNFIEIGQTSLEIGIGWKKNLYTQTDRLTHTWHPDWLSRASQHARGATKNADCLYFLYKVITDNAYSNRLTNTIYSINAQYLEFA